MKDKAEAYLSKLLIEKGYNVFDGGRHNAKDDIRRIRAIGTEEIKICGF